MVGQSDLDAHFWNWGWIQSYSLYVHQEWAKGSFPKKDQSTPPEEGKQAKKKKKCPLD